MSDIQSVIELLRSELHARIDASCDDFLAKFGNGIGKADQSVAYKRPTLADGHDPRNKNGLNLTDRGIEILYRVFDDDGGYNRAAKMLNISQGAAKNRKGLWVRDGGKSRPKRMIDIDTYDL